MNKITQKQLDSIKNAKTKEEAEKAYWAITRPAFNAYNSFINHANEAYKNWTPPKPDYSKMTKAELIAVIEKRAE